MLALIIIAMVDAEYGKTLSSEDLKEADTVEQLFERLKHSL
jgi:acyl carrier protein